MSGSGIMNKQKAITLLFAGSRDGLNTYGNNIKIVGQKLNGEVMDIT